MPPFDHVELTEVDMVRLAKLLADQAWEPSAAPATALALAARLGEATMVAAESISAHVVTMNSTLQCEDTASGERLHFTLVYPHDANEAQRRVSVLSPIGCAVLGASVGERVQLMWPNGYARELAIEALPFQPEANGQYWL